MKGSVNQQWNLTRSAVFSKTIFSSPCIWLVLALRATVGGGTASDVPDDEEANGDEHKSCEDGDSPCQAFRVLFVDNEMSWSVSEIIW